jgi:hypothetical protein
VLAAPPPSKLVFSPLLQSLTLFCWVRGCSSWTNWFRKLSPVVILSFCW